MTYYKCDGCGKTLRKEELRYRVKIEVCAVYEQNEIHLADIIRDHQQEILQLIRKMEGMSAEELEEQIYKGFEFDLCPACHRKYIQSPLRFAGEKGNNGKDESVGADIEGFLRNIINKEEKEN